MSDVKQDNRYWTIDALRGVAAMLVALYHIDLVTLQHSEHVVTQALHQVLRFGYLGVPIFFVISGFVIAGSISGYDINFRYFGKFLVKRQLRLDPTYWASIALDILLTLIAIKLFAATTPIPDLKKIILHVFYLQDLAGTGNIAAIYWTLCLEVQFYIVFCLSFALHNYLCCKTGTKLNIKAWLLALITGYSMLVAAGVVPSPLPGLFVTHWILFAMGAAAFQWGLKQQNCFTHFALFMSAALVVIALQWNLNDIEYTASLAIAWCTAVFFYVGAQYNKLGTWFNSKVLIYFGARSYSIYLFHTIIGERVAELLTQVIFKKMGLDGHDPVWALTAFAIGLGCSLITAEFAYRLIEMPSLMLSKKVKPSKPGSPLKELLQR